MEMAFDKVILVDSNDTPIGVMDKLEAHQKGLLHRAFSIFLFDSQGRMLLQKRAEQKYHCGGLWSNTCCSHPLPDTDMSTCLQRKLAQEMGINVTVYKAFDFMYEVTLENGLIEHEYDHVYIGEFNGSPDPNPEEVCKWCYASKEEIHQTMQQSPESFTPWFRMLYPKIEDYFLQVKRA